MKIKKGDNIIVIAGKDKGKGGKVVKTFPEERKVIVDGINISKKHRKATKEGQSGQIVEKAMPLNTSNVSLVCPQTGKPTRVSIKRENGKVKRIAQKSGASID